MISAEKLASKIAAKKTAIAQGIVALQNTVNGYDFNPNVPVKLADHRALTTVQTQAASVLTLINELGTLKNVSKKGGAGAGAGRARRARAF